MTPTPPITRMRKTLRAFISADAAARRGISLAELMVVVAVLSILLLLAVLPAYSSYAASRAARDAANRLAQDIALLERMAQDSGSDAGATLRIVSQSPLEYECLRGRPHELHAQWHLGEVLVRRRIAGAALESSPTASESLRLLFGRDGSIQYAAAAGWSDEHGTLALRIIAEHGGGAAAMLQISLATGSVDVR